MWDTAVYYLDYKIDRGQTKTTWYYDYHPNGEGVCYLHPSESDLAFFHRFEVDDPYPSATNLTGMKGVRLKIYAVSFEVIPSGYDTCEIQNFSLARPFEGIASNTTYCRLQTSLWGVE